MNRDYFNIFATEPSNTTKTLADRSPEIRIIWKHRYIVRIFDELAVPFNIFNTNGVECSERDMNQNTSVT